MKTSLAKPAPAAPEKFASRTEFNDFVGRRETLNEERLRLGREMATLGKEIAAMDQRLLAIVDAESRGQDRSITLRHFRLSIIQVAKGCSWLTELKKLVGGDKIEALKAAAGTRDALQIEWRGTPAASLAKETRSQGDQVAA